MADLPNPANNALATQDEGKDAVFANILETLQSNNSLLDEIEDNTESDESATEKRNRRIKDENTDPKEKGPGLFSNIGSGLKATGGALQKLNPFQDGVGSKKGMLMLAGILYAISRFGDKLIKPLADVLEFIDKEGGMLDKFKDTKFFQNAIVVFDKFKERAKLIGEDVARLLEAATQVSGFIAGAYNNVKAFIAKFDTGGEGPRNEYSDGKLDAFELQAMADTIKTNVKDAIVGFVGEVFKGIKGFILGASLLGITLKILKNHPVIMGIFGGVARTGTVAAAAGIGLSGYAGIAGLLIYGISTTWSNFTDSMKKSLEENDGEFKASDFFGRFFGGSDEGGWMNALGKAFDIGGTGALIGMGIGAFGGPVGILAGGFIGLGIGAVIGGLTGWFGKNKIEDFFDKIGTSITNTVDTVVGFFQDVIEGVESAIEGDGFTEGYNKSQGSNYERNKRKHQAAVDKLASYKSGENSSFNALGPSMQAKKIKKQEDKILKFKNLMEDAPQQKLNNLQADINKELEEIAAYEAEMKAGNMYRGIDPVTVFGKTFAPSDVSFSSLIAEKIEKIEAIRAEQDAHRIKFNLSGEVVPTQVEQAISEKKAAKEKIKSDLLQGYAAMAKGYTYSQPAVVPIINSDSHDSSFSTFVGSSLTPDNNSTGARLLSSGAYSTLGLDFLKNQ
jgi:hypothetical protein